MRIDKVVRTKRKTISIVVNSQGELLVRAPLHASDGFIEGLILKKEQWIREKQEIMKQRESRYELKTFAEGECFMYLGENHLLRYCDSEQDITVFNRMLLVPGRFRGSEQKIIEWYKKQAAAVISERVNHFAALTNLQYRAVKITSAAKRWGSCSSAGTLNFSWRLVMCPLPVIDYVVVHELCHRVHHNHSFEFWRTVKGFMPDYEERKHWLKENQRLMEIM